MNGFEYKYHTPSDIFNNILLIKEISFIDLGIFSAIIILFFSLQLYIIPIVNILIVNKLKQHEIAKRKNFIKQIAIQKDIEDHIAREIDVL